jgi:hypothetical protein
MSESLSYTRVAGSGPIRYAVYHDPSGARLGEITRYIFGSRPLWQADGLVRDFSTRGEAGAALFQKERDRTRGW